MCPECFEELDQVLEDDGPEIEAAGQGVIDFVNGSLEEDKESARAVEQEVTGRAKQIASALGKTKDYTTTAVARVQTAEGNVESWVASSEQTLRPAQRAVLKAGERAIKGVGHAEATIVDAVRAAGHTLHEIAASRPICKECADAISAIGGIISSALKPQ